MNIEDLKSTPDVNSLPTDYLKALWHDLNDDWDTAHTIVQALNDISANWIHAYLHRKEPDIWNAKYWYNRCGKPYPGDIPYDDEASVILKSLI
jgi:hypothetical protein